MKLKSIFLLAASFTFILASRPVHAMFSPNEAKEVTSAKKNAYVMDGIMWGGDPLASPLAMQAVRWANNADGYERIVLDLKGDGDGWKTKTPPYFQVNLDASDHKIIIGVRGIYQRAFNADELNRSLKKSAMVASAYAAPQMEGDLATISLQTRRRVEAEAFYLTNPPRIIVDVRSKK